MQNLPETNRKRVLVVDDDKDSIELLVTRLSIAGYDVSHARNGAEALERLRLSRPTAVILDINMPGMDGMDVLQWMQRTPVFATIPVMMLTASHANEDLKLAMRLGARDYMLKPFRDDVLLSRVARLFRRRPPGSSSGQGGGAGEAADDLLI